MNLSGVLGLIFNYEGIARRIQSELVLWKRSSCRTTQHRKVSQTMFSLYQSLHMGFKVQAPSHLADLATAMAESVAGPPWRLILNSQCVNTSLGDQPTTLTENWLFQIFSTPEGQQIIL